MCERRGASSWGKKNPSHSHSSLFMPLFDQLFQDLWVLLCHQRIYLFLVSSLASCITCFNPVLFWLLSCLYVPLSLIGWWIYGEGGGGGWLEDHRGLCDCVCLCVGKRVGKRGGVVGGPRRREERRGKTEGVWSICFLAACVLYVWGRHAGQHFLFLIWMHQHLDCCLYTPV